MGYTFPKHSKLCGQMRIAQLYKAGKRFVVWPLRVTYQPVEGDTQVLVWKVHLDVAGITLNTPSHWLGKQIGNPILDPPPAW